MAFEKGHPRFGGIKKGQKTAATKATIELKQMIRNAFELKGGEEWLSKQMDENPVAFMALLGKVLVKEINIDSNVSMGIAARLNAAREIMDAARLKTP